MFLACPDTKLVSVKKNTNCSCKFLSLTNPNINPNLKMNRPDFRQSTARMVLMSNSGQKGKHYDQFQIEFFA